MCSLGSLFFRSAGVRITSCHRPGCWYVSFICKRSGAQRIGLIRKVQFDSVSIDGQQNGQLCPYQKFPVEQANFLQRRITFDLPGHVVGVHFLAPRRRDELGRAWPTRDFHVLFGSAQRVVGHTTGE